MEFWGQFVLPLLLKGELFVGLKSYKHPIDFF
jgi:hypothetical protein